MGFFTAASLLAAFLHDSSTQTHHHHLRGFDAPSSSALEKMGLFPPTPTTTTMLFARSNRKIKPYPDELPWVPQGSDRTGYSPYFPAQEIVSRKEAVTLTYRLARVIARAGPYTRSWPLEYYYTRRLVDELQKELAGDEGIQVFRDLVSRFDPSNDTLIKLRGGRFLNEFVARWNGLNHAGRAEMQRITLKYLLNTAKQLEQHKRIHDDDEPLSLRTKKRLYEQNLPAGPRGRIEFLLESAERDIQLEVIMNYALRVQFGSNAQKLVQAEHETMRGVHDFARVGTFFKDLESSML